MTAGAKRPRTISLILWALILLGLWEAGRVVALGRQFRLLLELSVQPDPRVQIVLAVAWVVLFWGTAVALWRKKAFTRWFVPGVMLLFVSYHVALAALFVQSPGDNQQRLADVLLATAAVLFPAWALNRKTATAYYTEEGQQPTRSPV